MKKKKLLSFAIAAALATTCCFAAIPIVSQAAEETKEYTSGDWTYTFFKGECTITGYNGSDKDIVIPSELDGNTVMRIADGKWDSNKSRYNGVFSEKEITSVSIPDTIQFIGSGAFNYCSKLTNIDLGNGVKILNRHCFGYCDSLSSIDIPLSLASSGAEQQYDPFEGCNSLKTATIADGSEFVPGNLFYNCSALENIKIPEGTTKILGAAFFGCESLKEIVLPDSVQYIGSYAFASCKNLVKVDLGNGVISMARNIFEGCDSLTSIDIPASMTSSDASASYPFIKCDSLKTVTIASGGVKIPNMLFGNCGGLENIMIPEGIKEIGDYAFQGCASLKEIKLPSSVQKIGLSAFVDCSSLTDFYDYNKNTEYVDETITYTSDWVVIHYVFQNSPSVTIHGYPGSNAEAYAAEHDIPFVPLSGEEPDDPDVEGSMYRLYNPNSGEHFYTSSATEKDNLVSVGWTSEGVAWIAPTSSNAPVYRVYNPNSGEHHYTMDSAEKDFLVGLGWNDEGIGWYSDESQGVPLYRLYNPNATGQYEAGGHHYTKDTAERDQLVAAGWQDEGIGWYGK